MTDRVALAAMLVTAFLSCVFMIMLLYMRHNPLAWEDIWRGGYYYQSVDTYSHCCTADCVLVSQSPKQVE